HQFSQHPFTLHQALQRHGYRTYMILGGDHIAFYGMRAIYGRVDDYFDGSMVQNRYINDDRVIVEKTATLPEWDGRPVLMQFHLVSTHTIGLRDERFVRWQPTVNYALNRARQPENVQRAVN